MIVIEEMNNLLSADLSDGPELNEQNNITEGINILRHSCRH